MAVLIIISSTVSPSALTMLPISSMLEQATSITAMPLIQVKDSMNLAVLSFVKTAWVTALPDRVTLMAVTMLRVNITVPAMARPLALTAG
jgi:hypothetical protein